VSSDQGSDETSTIRNDINRVSQVRERVANDDRLRNRVMVDCDWKFIWYGPSTEILLEDEHF
jgi:hypothetical protein